MEQQLQIYFGFLISKGKGGRSDIKGRQHYVVDYPVIDTN